MWQRLEHSAVCPQAGAQHGLSTGWSTARSVHRLEHSTVCPQAGLIIINFASTTKIILKVHSKLISVTDLFIFLQ
jgi:hypothetical protein